MIYVYTEYHICIQTKSTQLYKISYSRRFSTFGMNQFKSITKFNWALPRKMGLRSHGAGATSSHAATN